MKKINNKIAKVIANISKKSAIKACGVASTHGAYQPVEPKALRNAK